MIGLDTNVLVRAAVGDDLDQAAQAKNRLSSMTAAEPGFVTHIVLVELWWVLTRAYKKKASEALSFLTRLTETATIVIQDRDLVITALAAVRDSGADFADALIVAVSTASDCSAVETFDAGAIKHAGMRQLPRELP